VNIPEALKTALALHTSGRLAEAEELYRRILAAEPEQAEAALHLARVVHQAGRPAEAAALYRAALAKTPDSFEILTDLSRALREAGDPVGAAEVLRRASQLAPEDAGPFVALGQILLELGRGREALAACRQALMRDPTGSAANLCTGQALLALGEPQRAAAHFRRIIETAPDASEAHNALGAALTALGDLDGAAAAFTRATELAPGGAEAYANLAGVLREAGQTEAASLAYDRAVDLGGGPGAMVKRALLLPVLPESVPEIDRARRRMADRLDRLRSGRVRLADPYREVGQTPCALACHGRDDRPLQESWAFFYRRACPELSFVADHCREPEAPKGRIRLGIVSAFLHDHTIGRLNRGFIERLDRSRFKLVVCRLPGRMDEYAAAAEAAADELVDPARRLLSGARPAGRQAPGRHLLPRRRPARPDLFPAPRPAGPGAVRGLGTPADHRPCDRRPLPVRNRPGARRRRRPLHRTPGSPIAPEPLRPEAPGGAGAEPGRLRPARGPDPLPLPPEPVQVPPRLRPGARLHPAHRSQGPRRRLPRRPSSPGRPARGPPGPHLPARGRTDRLPAATLPGAEPGAHGPGRREPRHLPFRQRLFQPGRLRARPGRGHPARRLRPRPDNFRLLPAHGNRGPDRRELGGVRGPGPAPGPRDRFPRGDGGRDRRALRAAV